MKKLLNTLYVTEEDAYLSLDGENIVVKLSDDKVFRLPFANFDSVYCFSWLGCSPALMGKLCEYGISLNFISPYGKFLGRLQGTVRGNVLLRTRQINMFTAPDEKDKERLLLLIRNTVAAKLANSCGILKRIRREHPESDEDERITECIEQLEDAAERVYGLSDRSEIMGLEGNAAKCYFSVFDRAFVKQRDAFTLTARTKRPPLDRTNAVLSYLYTICTYDIASALESVGLDSYVGYYHELRPGRTSLACDMVEEMRCLTERTVISAVNLRKLTSDDFEVQISGAVMLTKDGRKKVLSLWQENKKKEIMHPYLKQKIPLGLLPFVQCSLLAKFIRGEIAEYPSYLHKG